MGVAQQILAAGKSLTDGPAPTFVAVSANGSGTTAAMPSGWAAGDLLIIFATSYMDGTSCPGHDTPSGWVELGSWTNNYNISQYKTRTKVFYRIAQSGDSTVSLSVSNGEYRWQSYMMAYRGVNSASPFEASASLNDQNASAAPPYAQITTLGINRVVVQAITSWTPMSVSAEAGAGWTNRINSNNAIGLGVDTQTFASAGLTTSGSQTRDGSYEWGRMAFAIKPALA